MGRDSPDYYISQSRSSEVIGKAKRLQTKRTLFRAVNKFQKKTWNPLKRTFLWKPLVWILGGDPEDEKFTDTINCLPTCTTQKGDFPFFSISMFITLIVMYYCYTVPIFKPEMVKNFETLRTRDAVNTYKQQLDDFWKKQLAQAATKKEKNLVLQQARIPPALLSSIPSVEHIPQYPDFPNNFFIEKLAFYPFKKQQIWRYFSYSFLHIDEHHLFINVCLLLVAGTLLEILHGSWRVAKIYLAGVIVGSLLNFLVNRCILIGASAGIYAVLFSHWANYLVNMDKLPEKIGWIYVTLFNIPLVALFLYDLIQSIVDPRHTQKAYVSHLGGIGTAILYGSACIRNIHSLKWERWFRRNCRNLFYVWVVIMVILQPSDSYDSDPESSNTYNYEVNTGGENTEKSYIFMGDYRVKQKVCVTKCSANSGFSCSDTWLGPDISDPCDTGKLFGIIPPEDDVEGNYIFSDDLDPFEGEEQEESLLIGKDEVTDFKKDDFFPKPNENQVISNQKEDQPKPRKEIEQEKNKKGVKQSVVKTRTFEAVVVTSVNTLPWSNDLVNSRTKSANYIANEKQFCDTFGESVDGLEDCEVLKFSLSQDKRRKRSSDIYVKFAFHYDLFSTEVDLTSITPELAFVYFYNNKVNTEELTESLGISTFNVKNPSSVGVVNLTSEKQVIELTDELKGDSAAVEENVNVDVNESVEVTAQPTQASVIIEVDDSVFDNININYGGNTGGNPVQELAQNPRIVFHPVQLLLVEAWDNNLRNKNSREYHSFEDYIHYHFDVYLKSNYRLNLDEISGLQFYQSGSNAVASFFIRVELPRNLAELAYLGFTSLDTQIKDGNFTTNWFSDILKEIEQNYFIFLSFRFRIFGQSFLLDISFNYYTGVSVVTKRQGEEYITTKGQRFGVQYPVIQQTQTVPNQIEEEEKIEPTNDEYASPNPDDEDNYDLGFDTSNIDERPIGSNNGIQNLPQNPKLVFNPVQVLLTDDIIWNDNLRNEDSEEFNDLTMAVEQYFEYNLDWNHELDILQFYPSNLSVIANFYIQVELPRNELAAIGFTDLDNQIKDGYFTTNWFADLLKEIEQIFFY